MKITRVEEITTRDDVESFEIPSLVGVDAPSSYHINYQNKGFAKFLIDKKSMAEFSQKLGRIEDSLSRKQLYNIMYDMLKTQDLSGAQLVSICQSQLVNEVEPDVIQDLLGGRNAIVQGCIKAYIPLYAFEQYNHDIF